MFRYMNVDIKNTAKVITKTKPALYDKGSIKLYFYGIKYTRFEENLCKTEMKYLFNRTPESNYFLSNHYVDPSRSPFIKQCLKVIYSGQSLQDILNQILTNNLSFEKFKVRYINIESESIAFDERRKIESVVGFNINGRADIHNPEILLGVTYIRGKWLLGIYEENKLIWKQHDDKPYHYSNALGVRAARALVNLAVRNNLKSTLIDPCCGIGTVVMEALSMGIAVRGYEINPLIAENASRNLEFFGYENVITNGDMHTINGHFDAAVVDLPYGVFNPTTLEQQVGIIQTARRIADRMVLISFEDMDQHILKSGFNILDKCHVDKGKFIRYITICK